MKAFTFCSFMLLALAAGAQTFDVDTVLWNGDIDKRINIVVLGDGYQASELAKFEADANAFSSALFSEPPYTSYKNYFNFFIVKVPSNESGVDHPGTATDVTEPEHPILEADTYFGVTFDAYDIHRLVVANDIFSVVNVLASNFPEYDQVFILANSPYYGGGGGPRPVSTTHDLAGEIAIHEMGHSFAGLKDEYWAGDIYAQEALNMTQENDPAFVKWKNWYGDNNIGIFPYCCDGTSASWYKPSNFACKMEALNLPFCAVCKEAIVEKIHDLINPVESFFPADPTLEIDSMLGFKLNLIQPEPNTLKTRWQLNGSEIACCMDTLTLFSGDLIQGFNTVHVSVEDTTQFLRVDDHEIIHLSTVAWAIDNTPSGTLEISPASEKIRLDIFPNPAGDYVNIAFKSQRFSEVKIELYDLSGKFLDAVSRQSLAGEETLFSINLNARREKVLLLKILVNGHIVATKKLMKE